VGEYYGKEDTKTRRARRSSEETAEVRALREQVARIPQLVEDQVQARIPQILEEEMEARVATAVDERVERKLNALLPGLLAGYGNWDRGGRRGPAPIPNMVSSESDNMASAMLVTPPATTAAPEFLVTSPATTTVPELNAPGTKNTPASIHSHTCTPPAVDGASTLAELNAIKVT